MYNQTFECKSWFYHDKPQLVTGQELRLQREPNNAHDANAVEIVTEGGAKVGYIPANMAADICAMMNRNTVLFVSVMAPYDEELETPPWLHVQDLDSRLEAEASARKWENTSSNTNKAILIGVPILIFLALGGCVAAFL